MLLTVSKIKGIMIFIVTSADTVKNIELLDKIKTGMKLAEDFDVGTSTI